MKLSFKFSLLFWLITLSFFARLVTAYIFGDQVIDNEWSILVNNLINYKSFSFYVTDEQIIPSVYMPPMYPLFLYFTKIITFEKLNFLNSIFFFQTILSTYSVYIFYKINQKIFSNKLSLINALIFSLFPLNLYAVGQISSISLQLFFSLLFLKYFLSLSECQSRKNIIIFSVVSGMLILTRGEFILIFVITFSYLIFCKKIGVGILIKTLLIVSLIISPYIIRNYITFNEIVIVKSLGFNLWKGNNHTSSVGGSSSIHPPNDFSQLKQWTIPKNPEFTLLKKKLESIKHDKYYEINRDQIFLDEAKNNLSKNPYRYLNLFFKKIFSYYFVDLKSNYPNYYNFFHFFPVLILSIFSLPGLIIALKKNKFELNYLIIYLSLNLIIFSIFFVLPRYKLIILPIQIILAAYFIQQVLHKLNMKYL